MALTQAEIDELIDDNILTGGRRTFAVGTREVLHEINSALFANNLTLTTYNPNPLQRVYQIGNTCVQGGKIYIAIAETSGTFDPYDWEEISEGGGTGGGAVWGDITGTITNQTDLITYLNANYQPIGSDAESWLVAGNTLTGRGKIGGNSGSGAYGFDFQRAGTTYGGLGNTTGWFWGTNAAFTDTYFSIKSSSNLGTFNALAIKDSDNTTIFEFKSTGNIKTAGGFLNASDNTVCNFYASNLYRENSGPKVVVDWRNTLLKDNDAVDRLNWHYGWLLSGVTVDLDWGNHRLEGSWKVIENFSIGATPSYGGGTGVMFIANAGTIPSTDPVDGFILYVDPADDKLKARGPGGLVTVLANPV